MTWTMAVAMAGGCAAEAPSGSGDTEDDGNDDGSGTAATEGTSADEGSTAAPADDTGSVAEVVYWRDIKPIVDARCGACHSAEGVAPFALDSFAQVELYGESMLAQVQAGVMPPWPADDDCNDYRYDPSLSSAELDAIAAWVELGKPEGDPADEGAALPVATAELPRVDFELAMAEPHVATPPGGGVDEHVCFLVEWPEDHDVFVSGYEVIPGNRKVVHHLVARVVDAAGVEELRAQDLETEEDGWPCGAGTGMSGGGGPLLGVWVPGQGASVLPEGTGMRVEPGSAVLMNMHYNTVMGDTSPDQTAIAFMVEDEVEQEGISQFLTDPSWPVGDNMLIEAGDADSVHDFSLALPAPITVYALGLHMHTLGAYGSLKVERSGGAIECGLEIPRWDFGWQLGYTLTQPLELAAGDRMQLQCGYDNSQGNQPVIDGELRPPQDVTWGEDTYDEMCLGFVYLTRG